jgi:hypothetical protein
MSNIGKALATDLKKKEVIREFRFESSSSPGSFYVTKVYRDGAMSCNCKGWIFSLRKHGVRKCKHTTEVAGQLDEREVRFKVQGPPAVSKTKTQKEPATPVTVVLAKPTRRFSFEE